MHRLLFGLLIACGGGPKPAPEPVANQPAPAVATATTGTTEPMVQAPACNDPTASCVIRTFEGFTKQMCACADKSCAEQLNTTMTAWGTEMAKRADKEQKPTVEEQKQLADIVTRYADCMTKVMINGAPPPDPCGGGDPCGN